MRICIVSRIDIKEPIELAQSIGWMLRDLGHDVMYEESVAAELGYSPVSLSKDFSADLIIILGGDGSVLRTIRMLEKQVPVVGINQGLVGFLTDIDRDKAEEILTSLSLPLPLDPRMRISIEYNGTFVGSALN
ncbi:MAG TPA: NAD(+)/NADH kinase [Methanocorpusculum sp.]|nr:NAD(+)/NADH kinase [Methanocorpusculum sp.]